MIEILLKLISFEQNPADYVERLKVVETVFGVRVFSFKKRKIQIQNNINAKVGEKVKLVIEENYLLKTSLLLYGVPLFFLFGGMIASEYFLEATNDLVVFSWRIIRILGRNNCIKIHNSSKSH